MSNTKHAKCHRGVPRNVREFHIVWRMVTLKLFYTSSSIFRKLHEYVFALLICTSFVLVVQPAGLYIDSVSSVILIEGSRHHLTVPRYRLCTFGRLAFSVAGPTVWNLLLDSLHDQALTSNSFRQSLKTILFHLYH